MAHRSTAGAAGRCSAPELVRFHVHDVLFVLLIIAVFGVLALCAKGAEKL